MPQDTCPTILLDQFSLLDLLPVGICLLNDQYLVLHWNSCLALWTGHYADDVQGRDLRTVFPHLAAAKYTTRIDDVLKGGPPAIFSAQLHRFLFPSTLPDGAQRLQHTVVNAVKGVDGRHYAMFTAQDVTETFNRLKAYSEMRDQALQELEERRRVEQALRESEGKIASIADAVLDAVIMLDTAGLIQFWNQSAERILGYDADEAMERNFFELLLPEAEREELRQALGGFEATGQAPLVGHVTETEVLRKNGEIFPAEFLAATFRYAGSWHAALIIRDITERKAAEQRLQELASTDELTGLFNRRAFMERARDEVLRAKRYGHELSLIMLDADHFKNINDSFGHDVGDEVLRQLAHTCRDSVRAMDMVGRLGGEEFGILLPETPLCKAVRVAERIRKGIEDAVLRCHGSSIHYTASLGVSALLYDSESVEFLLKSADKALYRAKNLGRNRVESYSGNRAELEQD